MLGTNIRSIRHLFRMSDASLKTILINFERGHWDICKAIKTPKDSIFGESLFIFNNVYHHSKYNVSHVLESKDVKKSGENNNLSNYSRLIQMNENDISSLSQIFTEIICLEDTFEEDYQGFIQSNAKVIKSLRSSYGINIDNIKVKMLYIFSDGSKNFFQWAVTTYFKNGISMSTIRNILTWNEMYSQLTKNLSKGTITAYTSRNSILALVDELSEIRKAKRINDSINSFNTTQKKMLKECEMSNDIKQALWKLSRLSETKRLNFIKKMSSVTDLNEFIRQLKFVTSVHFAWNKESFLDYVNNVEGIKFEKVFETDNVILVKVFDFETVKQLGKTTNWCISKNKKYWNDYIESHFGKTTQYMVFDFSKMEDDKLSIIGFTTTRNRGITSAHNFVNDNLMGNDGGQERVMLNSFIDKFKTNNNIYSILDNSGIDITMVIEYDKPNYEWDKENLLSYLYECVDKANVDIIKSSDNKMVLSVTDENIRYFFGETYCENVDSYYYNCQHLIFIDFNKSKYDSNKIQFAIIDENDSYEEFCAVLYNECSVCPNINFDTLLTEYGLPYNTIKRINDPLSKLKNAIASYNSVLMKESMKECSKEDLIDVIKNSFGGEYYYETICRSVCNYMSFDYLNLIYDNGLLLSDVMDAVYVGDLVKNFANDLRRNAVDVFAQMEGVTDAEIDDFFNKNLNRREVAQYVGYYIAIKMILQHEDIKGKKCNYVYKRFISFMTNNRYTEIYEQIFNLIKDDFDYNQNDDTVFYIADYASKYASNEFKNFIFEKAKENKTLNNLLSNFEAKKTKQKEEKICLSPFTITMEAPNLTSNDIFGI